MYLFQDYVWNTKKYSPKKPENVFVPKKKHYQLQFTTDQTKNIKRCEKL